MGRHFPAKLQKSGMVVRADIDAPAVCGTFREKIVGIHSDGPGRQALIQNISRRIHAGLRHHNALGVGQAIAELLTVQRRLHIRGPIVGAGAVADQLLPVPQPQLLQSVSGAADVVLQGSYGIAALRIRPQQINELPSTDAALPIQNQIRR